MGSVNILEPSLIKDLSNHIYEKRKATAFQIESLTKAALARNDSQTIYKIINELTELTNGGTNSAKMGAITALGSVSVALGSFAIAYFLEEIIKPIFATFRDTDARVRYYACESLYNIAKIARGEMLLYFNEVFDILCILVTDTESSVKNAADILDRLIKDIVSAKSTNYVSILQQQELSNEIQTHLVDANGVAIQVNQVQDSQKAFSLPKFIPTLLERMYTIDPFAKKFLISWLELFDDIPSLELITFLPNFLEPLIRFLMNSSPSDVRLETSNILNVFLKEIKSIYKVKYEVKKNQLIQEKKKAQKEKEAAERIESVDNISDEVKEIKLHQSEEDDTNSIKSDDTTIVRKIETDDQEPESVDFETNDGEPQDGLFLNGQDIFIDYAKIIEILLTFIRTPDEKGEMKNTDLSNEPHEIYLEIQYVVLKWLLEILETVPIGFVKCLPECVSIVVSNISITDDDKDFELRNQFLDFNRSLQELLIRFSDADDGNTSGIEEEDFVINDNLIHGLTKEVYDEFVEYQLQYTLSKIMSKYLNSTNELSRITSLEWLLFLYTRNPQGFFQFVGEGENKFDLTSLLKSCTDASNDVVLKVLQLLSKISEANDEFFKDFMIKLIRLLEKEKSNPPTLTRGRIEFIIRKLCVSLNSEKIFKTLSEVLVSLDDLEFLNVMIVTLNDILLTTLELCTFRKKLKNLDVYKIEDWSLFATLFQSWCHNAPSALSLCLLTSNYELAYLIIKNLSELEVTFQLLTQLDILVQLIESPIFLKLRLQLLEPEKHPYLYRTLYGLLMILPQSSTFTTLNNRLSSITHVHSASAITTAVPAPIGTPVSTPGPAGATTPGVSNQLSIKRKRIYEMLDKFTKVQERHEEYAIDRKVKGAFNEQSNDGYSKDRLISYNMSFPEKKDYFSEAGQSTRRY
ncbi:ARM repeat-containing protein [Suhomyces tanzawaensis NRRL Y-17324]|uniref:ARM repeat-containing protein n=1 Tax=Suhomyces tanzawaensis NRRL Y-17324 TaxID=984487 RepID=A0A1E4SLB1_9ASCO|nr:ARM repeat-containing protein [Suhomyces tanzawaensis NRRL Y-17324]ODV80301.1 ARM repeat-containing protein [Suhomyces tanzawaensis NRRL Y-17324]